MINYLNTMNHSCQFYWYTKYPEILIKEYSQSDCSSPLYREGFLLESLTMQKLWENCPSIHSIIPRYYNIPNNQKQPKLYMEYIHGWSLQEYLPLHQQPHLLAQLCKDLTMLLSCLYDNGIVYMDLTPENIIVTSPTPTKTWLTKKAFTFKLIDFTFCEYPNYHYSFIPKRSSYHIDITLPHHSRFVQVLAYFLARLFYKNKHDFECHFQEHRFIKEHPQFHMLFYYGFHPDNSIHINDWCKSFINCLLSDIH